MIICEIDGILWLWATDNKRPSNKTVRLKRVEVYRARFSIQQISISSVKTQVKAKATITFDQSKSKIGAIFHSHQRQTKDIKKLFWHHANFSHSAFVIQISFLSLILSNSPCAFSFFSIFFTHKHTHN